MTDKERIVNARYAIESKSDRCCSWSYTKSDESTERATGIVQQVVCRVVVVDRECAWGTRVPWLRWCRKNEERCKWDKQIGSVRQRRALTMKKACNSPTAQTARYGSIRAEQSRRGGSLRRAVRDGKKKGSLQDDGPDYYYYYYYYLMLDDGQERKKCTHGRYLLRRAPPAGKLEVTKRMTQAALCN